MAPRELALPLQSLPPILHMKNQDPISGYSKGARGLSVQSRVSGIFTATTVSPSSCRRQQSSRYTIRAGRNLPDKEFRYLRTVHDCYSRAGLPGDAVISAALSASPRRSDYTITTSRRVRRLVSEDSRISRGSRRPCNDVCRRRSCPTEWRGSCACPLRPGAFHSQSLRRAA